MGRVLGPDDVEPAIRGGSVFACGGGGWEEHGRKLGLAAVNTGQPELVGLDEIPDDAFIATAAAIGAPAGTTNWEMHGIDYVNAVRLVMRELGSPIHGLMVGQNGRSSTLNAWLPAAVLGIKVVDAVGDIRAHPTGDMGSIGMAGSTEPMIQSAVGGHRASGAYLELVIRGATAKVSPVLRTAADMSGGFIASCRNPLRASYIRRHAALGGISRALALGEAILAAEGRGGPAVVDTILRVLNGRLLGSGPVTASTVAYTDAAFDVGTVTLGAAGNALTLHVMNEYMAVDDAQGVRLATFPDVIATLDESGRPVSVGELRDGMRLLVLHVDKRHLPLSSSVKDPAVYPVVEAALGIDLVSYALDAS